MNNLSRKKENRINGRKSSLSMIMELYSAGSVKFVQGKAEMLLNFCFFFFFGHYIGSTIVMKRKIKRSQDFFFFSETTVHYSRINYINVF